MLINLLFIARIFSEEFNLISSVIGGIFLLLTIDLVLVNRLKLIFTDYCPFFNFWMIYTLINFLWIFVAYYYYGLTLIVPGIYLTLKSLSILCVYILIKSEKWLKGEHILKLLTTIIFIYAGIAIIDSFDVLLGIGKFSIFVDGELRSVWPLNHPNSLGFIFSVLISYLILTKNLIFMKYPLMIVLSIGLLSTKSISAIGFLSIVLLIFYSNIGNVKRNIMFIVTIAILYLSLGDLLVGDRMLSLNTDLHYYANSWNQVVRINEYSPWTNSAEWRLANWRNFYNIFYEYPLLGKGTLNWMIENPYRSQLGEIGGYNPHSEFFGWIAQFGLIGTIILLYYTLKTCYIFLLNKKKQDKAYKTIFVAILITGIIGKEILYVQVYYLLILDIFIRNGVNHTSEV